MSGEQSHAADCPICGRSGPLRPKLRKRGYDILQCPDCGVGRAIAPDFSPERFYTDSYFSGGHEDGYVDYVGSEKVLRREFKRQCAFLRRFTSGGKLLEIGCAYGFFLQEARREFDVYGMEMAQSAVEYCHRNGLANVQAGAVTRRYLEDNGPFDAIVMLDVIEHIDDVVSLINLMTCFLKPGGVVLITTGDWNSLFARLTGASWRLIAPPLHLWYFTPQGLGKMFGRFGCHMAHLSHPWKRVPLELVIHQAAVMVGVKGLAVPPPFRHLGLPANLFDAMRLVFRKETNASDSSARGF